MFVYLRSQWKASLIPYIPIFLFIFNIWPFHIKFVSYKNIKWHALIKKKEVGTNADICNAMRRPELFLIQHFFPNHSYR